MGEQKQSLLSVASAEQGAHAAIGNFTAIWDCLERSPQEPQCRTEPSAGEGTKR